MASKELKNKPLVESIFEIRWQLQSSPQGLRADPLYKLMLGRLFDRLRPDYPEHESLPAAAVPDEIVAQIVQYRFRSDKNDWPLVQVGPGILSVNDTTKYTWDDFHQRCAQAVECLFEAHPEPSTLIIEGLLLRYIDAVAVDFHQESVLSFLNDKMKVTVAMPRTLFEHGTVADSPSRLSFQAGFNCSAPAGMAEIGFAMGNVEGQSSLIWETKVASVFPNVPGMPTGFRDWIQQAHEICHAWFFKLIEGDLERRFEGG